MKKLLATLLLPTLAFSASNTNQLNFSLLNCHKVTEAISSYSGSGDLVLQNVTLSSEALKKTNTSGQSLIDALREIVNGNDSAFIQVNKIKKIDSSTNFNQKVNTAKLAEANAITIIQNMETKATHKFDFPAPADTNTVEHKLQDILNKALHEQFSSYLMTDNDLALAYGEIWSSSIDPEHEVAEEQRELVARLIQGTGLKVNEEFKIVAE